MMVAVVEMVVGVEVEPPTSASGPEVVSGLLTFPLRANKGTKRFKTKS